MRLLTSAVGVDLAIVVVVFAAAIALAMFARSRRGAAAAICAALVGATAYPVVLEPTEDSFPLSTYPMFARPRKTAQTIDYALGETAAGARRTLTPRLVGSAEVLQAQSVINRARSTGTLPALCKAIAGRVAGDARYADVVAILVVTGKHDAVEFLVRDQRGPEIERVRCEVMR